MNLFKASNVEIDYKISDLTILSYGAGQDSTTLLFLCVYDEAFRQRYAPGKLLVLFADTGNENPLTYDYIQRVTVPFCIEHNIEFVEITSDLGYHGETWQSLTHQWENGTPTVGSCAYMKTCTANLKLVPQFRYVEDWLHENYDEVDKKNRKEGYVQFAKHYGKIRWLIGIAKGEERRVADAEAESAVWRKQAIHVEYPLVELGLDRQRCQDYIKSIDKEIPWPSNCLYCPYASNKMELLWLNLTYPDYFDEWVKYEQAKLDAHTHIVKNLGVSGRLHKSGDRKGKAVTLLDILEEAKAEYPNITLNELSEYRFSHGHCIVSKY